MKRFVSMFLVLAICVLSHAQSSQVEITEIAPHKINDEEEWFEFEVSGEVVNVSQWMIKGAKGKVKHFKDYGDQLLWNSSIEVIDLENLEFKLLKGSGYFAWNKSPLSLPNGGGVVELWDGDQLLDRVEYPKLKSGTYKSHKYAEVWTRDEEKNQFYPRLYRSIPGNAHRHSKLRENKSSPPFSTEIEILISEIGMLRDQDFVELFIKSLPEKSSLEYLTVKHNGAIVFEGSVKDKIVEGDYLLVHPEKGLSGGSGTTEIILWSDTSWEIWEDVVCYKKGDLSKGESKRVEKYRSEGSWKSDCYDISGFPDNVSLARNIEYLDTNQKEDFFAHVNGSPGGANVSSNHTPQAIIRLQNTDKVVRKVPFSVNLTGAHSKDPDGVKDIVKYTWTVNDLWFSDVENPSYYKILEPGDYVFKLRVEDLSGKWDEDEILIAGVEKLTDDVQSSIINIHEQEVDPNPSENMLDGLESDSFFGDFINVARDAISKSDKSFPEGIDYFQARTHREKLAFWGRMGKVENNLGQIFLEN